MRDLTTAQWRALAPMLERVRPRTGREFRDLRRAFAGVVFRLRADTETGDSLRPLSATACDVLRRQGPGAAGALVFPPSGSVSTRAKPDGVSCMTRSAYAASRIGVGAQIG